MYVQFTMYIIHNMENEEEENPLTTHYTREKHMKGRRKGTQVRSERLFKGGRWKVNFPVSVHIYHHNCVLFLQQNIYKENLCVFFFVHVQKNSKEENWKNLI